MSTLPDAVITPELRADIISRLTTITFTGGPPTVARVACATGTRPRQVRGICNELIAAGNITAARVQQHRASRKPRTRPVGRTRIVRPVVPDTDVTPEMTEAVRGKLRQGISVKWIAAGTGAPTRVIREIGASMGLHWDPATHRMQQDAPPPAAPKLRPALPPLPHAAPTGDENWQLRAACKGMGVDQFFPEVGRVLAPAARAVCASCPVRGDCLQYAIDRPEPIGWWGGISPEDRNRSRRNQLRRRPELTAA